MVWAIGLAVVLYLACAALLVAEVFVPSGGLLTVCALGCLGGGVTLFFQQNAALGWAGLAVAGLLIPTTLILAYRAFPRTRFGRAVTLRPPERTRGDGIPDREELAALPGRSGCVVTPLRPVGTCDFSGRKVECVAESGYVDVGQRVTVVRVEGMQVTVRIEDSNAS